MKINIDFPSVDVINVPSSGIMWDFSSRKNVYFINGFPTLTIELSTEEFKRVHEILKNIKRIGSHAYEVEFEGRKYLAKIKVDGREVNIDL